MKLTRKLIYHAVLGICPSYCTQDDRRIKPLGKFDAHRGCWKWNEDKLKSKTTDSLYKIFELCLKSWEEQ